MRLLYIVLWKSLSFVIVTGILLFLNTIDAQSQALNLTGLIALDYHSSVTLSDIADQETTSRVSDLLQSYMISSSGVIVDPRLASYSANIGISDSVYKNKPASGESTKINRDTVTYSLQMNLIPTRFPVNVFAQRNMMGIENAPDLLSDTYSVGWSASLRTQTALRMTLLQIGTEYQDPNEPRDTRVRIANLGLSQPFRTGFLSSNLQYTDYLVTTKDDKTQSKVSSYSMRGENRLSPFLFLSGNVTYFPKGGFFTPGITTTAETTGDVGLLNQVERFTQSGNYSFRKTEGGDLERDSLSYSMSYRPLGKTDYRGDAVYSSTGSELTDSKEYRLAGGVSHRPYYGLSITDNIILHHFDVSGINTNKIDRIGNMIGINYFKLLDVFNLNSNYSADYSTVFSDDENADGNIFTQTASIGAQSRTLQAIQLMTSYTFLIRSNSIVPTDNRQEQMLRIEAQSVYFKKFTLRASSSFSDVLDYGNTFTFNTRAEYSYGIGTRLAGEYKLSNYPGVTDTQDSQLYIIEGTHVRNITWRLGINLTVRGEREELKFTNRDRAIMTAMLNYQLGRVAINFEFREDYTKYPESVYNIQTYFVRASRPF
ncbi:MAG: hypothetical protein AABY41_04765 [Nitrospirota bacterium]|mgnify:CR=1 FL=1